VDAKAYLQSALRWGREKGLVRYQVPAEVFLAANGAGDLLAARVSLEQHEGSLSVTELLECHYVLWEATGEPVHLVQAREALAKMKEGARPEDRESLVQNVEIHRRVATATP
jgi:hypothetical protein